MPRSKQTGAQCGRISSMPRWLLCSLAAAAPLAGCSLKYSYTEPTGAERAELAALTEPGLEVDTGMIPADVPSGPVVAPLDHHHNNHFLTAQINGRKVDLVVDWGSWVTLALFPRTVRRAEATLSDRSMEASTIDYSGEMRTGVVDTLSIEDATFRDVPFAMINRDLTVTLGLITVYRGKGLIGLPVFAAYERFAIDMADSTLHLGAFPAELIEAPNVITIPFEFEQGMIIDAQIEGQDLRLKVDIGGSHRAVTLDDEAARQFVRQHAPEFAGYSTGVGESAVPALRATASAVRISSYERRDVPVRLLMRDDDADDADGVASDPHPGGVAGVLGNAFFGRTIVGVDWAARELRFIAVH